MSIVVLTICLGIQTLKAGAITAVVWSGRKNMSGIVRRVADGWAVAEWAIFAGIVLAMISM